MTLPRPCGRDTDAILYGSFAAGDATPVSDYDIAGFADSRSVERISGKWRNSYLDLFLYPESRLDSPNPEMLHLRSGVVLFEKAEAGSRFLAKLDEIFALGPERLPQSELRARRRWAWKMLDRAAKEDVEGNFRRAWLLTALLEAVAGPRTEETVNDELMGSRPPVRSDV
jgi:predicted nucleotidyltransferase